MAHDQEREARRAEFEAAYRENYPTTCQINTKKFDRDEFNQYEDTTVEIAFKLFKAGAARCSAPQREALRAEFIKLAKAKKFDTAMEYGEFVNSYVRYAFEGFALGRRSAPQREACAVPKLTDIEQYNVQMSAIGTAALGYWTEAAGIKPEYDTPVLRDVARLYAKYEAALAAASPPHLRKHRPQENRNE